MNTTLNIEIGPSADVLIYLLTWHPVAGVQYTVTHEQYTEQHKLPLWLEGFLGFEPRVVRLKLMMN